MKSSTVIRIIDNSHNRKITIIGKYSYKFNPYTGHILRCETDKIGRGLRARNVKWEVVNKED